MCSNKLTFHTFNNIFLIFHIQTFRDKYNNNNYDKIEIQRNVQRLANTILDQDESEIFIEEEITHAIY